MLRLLLLFFLTGITLYAGEPLKGFRYAREKQPTGHEWESPEELSLNKEQPRAYFFSFPNKEAALNVLPEASDFVSSLNGNWKFKWVPVPEETPANFQDPDFDDSGWDDVRVPLSWNIYGIQPDGTQKYGVPIYVNQPVIFYHEIKEGDWKKGVMRTPPADWTVYKHRNEVGSFRRFFEIPTEWKGKEVFINFDGVDSFFYLWINGSYVGFSKNSRNAARFRITPYLKNGMNTLAVQVYRNSDGSFLEAQDMFRLPGIYRSVYLTAVPAIHIADLVAIPDLDAQYKNGVLNVECLIKNEKGKYAEKGMQVKFSLYENRLYSDEIVSDVLVRQTAAIIPGSGSQSCGSARVQLHLNEPELWSAEHPGRYTLIAELTDKKGRTVETVSIHTAFRKVEIKDTPASEDEFGLSGRYFYINGKTVKLKGVNRHETNPETGKVISREQMEREIMLMKRANINHVRNSHYPDDPYWYYLCDKYGIYLEDEANIESHQYYYGKASLSHPVEWRNAHVARVMEMVHSTVNRPSVVIWSLGNEAGPGDNFKAAYQAVKAFDRSRPVQYERNNSIVDMGSNQYPSIAWVNEAVKGTYDIKYPFHISEYAHSMGNACGNLKDYWQAIESTNFFCGAAIWDWVDQAMYNYTPEGVKYQAYGGNFGDYPNDGQFVMNGIMFADFKPKPQYFEVKKVYQYAAFGLVGAAEIEVFNKNYFTNLDDYVLAWQILKNGKIVEEGTSSVNGIEARKRALVTLPVNTAAYRESDAEYLLNVGLKLKEDKPWAEQGYMQAEEQFILNKPFLMPQLRREMPKSNSLTSMQNENLLTVKGEGFEVDFDLKKGTIDRLSYRNKPVIASGNGPRLEPFRAFTNNDNWIYANWFALGLHNLQHRVTGFTSEMLKDGSVMLSFTVVSQAPYESEIKGGTSSGKNMINDLKDKPFILDNFHFNTHQVWVIAPDGTIYFNAAINSNDSSVILPRLGYVVKVSNRFDRFNYYGRGPMGNYPDRKAGSPIGLYSSTVDEQMVPFPKPQDCANHEAVRWLSLTDCVGDGIEIMAADSMSAQILPYSALDMTLCGNLHNLKKSDVNYLHLDCAVTGLGGNSCGQGGPLKPDRVYGESRRFGFILKPLSKKEVEPEFGINSRLTPISIEQDAIGSITLTGTYGPVMYKLNNDKAHLYTQSFDFRKGGRIEVWYKDFPQIKRIIRLKPVDKIKTAVVKSSSEESGFGDATHLTDGENTTMWHSVYSVTVAKYPHWVVFDAGEERQLKGMTYLPRQDGSNTGDIKEYEVYLSSDGEHWDKPVAKGVFDNSKNEKRVSFTGKKKARYIKFVALSEQNGRDYASGAEMTILSD